MLNKIKEFTIKPSFIFSIAGFQLVLTISYLVLQTLSKFVI